LYEKAELQERNTGREQLSELARFGQDTKIHIADTYWRIKRPKTQGALVAILIDGNSSVVAVSNIGIEYSFRTKNPLGHSPSA